MLRKTSLALLTVLFSVAAFGCDCETQTSTATPEVTPIEVMGIVNAPTAAIGGETTGMRLLVPQREAYELEVADPELLGRVEKLNATLVKVTGDVFTKEGVETQKREIIKVAKIEVVPQELKCEGTQFKAGVYETGTLVTIEQKDKLLSILKCAKDQEQTSCRESNMVDAGYEVTAINELSFHLYEVSFAGKKQVDTLVCQKI
jgi:hypothetical protein